MGSGEGRRSLTQGSGSRYLELAHASQIQAFRGESEPDTDSATLHTERATRAVFAYNMGATAELLSTLRLDEYARPARWRDKDPT